MTKEALVKANLALELVDGLTDDKIDRARESASNAISESRSWGVEPVLAVSYYEYAQSLVNESALDSAIVYYKYSDIIAGALTVTGGYSNRSSRYVGVPEIEIPDRWQLFNLFDFWYFVLFFLVGVIMGVGLGLIGAGIAVKKRQKKDYYEQWMPRSIQDYYKKHK